MQDIITYVFMKEIFLSSPAVSNVQEQEPKFRPIPIPKKPCTYDNFVCPDCLYNFGNSYSCQLLPLAAGNSCTIYMQVLNKAFSIQGQ